MIGQYSTDQMRTRNAFAEYQQLVRDSRASGAATAAGYASQSGKLYKGKGLTRPIAEYLQRETATSRQRLGYAPLGTAEPNPALRRMLLGMERDPVTTLLSQYPTSQRTHGPGYRT